MSTAVACMYVCCSTRSWKLMVIQSVTEWLLTMVGYHNRLRARCTNAT